MAAEQQETTYSRPDRSRLGAAALVAGLAGWSTWLVWRLTTLHAHPVPIVMLLIELSALASGVAVAAGLAYVERPREVAGVDARDAHRYALVVADHVGRTQSADLHHDMRSVVDRLRARDLSGPADRALVAVMTDGPRRIAFVVALAVALVVGTAPFPRPPVWALVAVLIGIGAIAASHVILTGGRIRFGDRTRWSFAALGEVIAPNDPAGVAPRRWVGTVGAIVTLNLAVGLRGISDRWTHGLPQMSDDDRLVVIALAMVTVAGALFTLRTMPSPSAVGTPLTSRRLEERTARRSALGAAVCVGVVGLIAGILPAGVDAADGDTPRVEPVAELEVDARD